MPQAWSNSGATKPALSVPASIGTKRENDPVLTGNAACGLGGTASRCRPGDELCLWFYAAPDERINPVVKTSQQTDAIVPGTYSVHGQEYHGARASNRLLGASQDKRLGPFNVNLHDVGLRQSTRLAQSINTDYRHQLACFVETAGIAVWPGAETGLAVAVSNGSLDYLDRGVINGDMPAQ